MKFRQFLRKSFQFNRSLLSHKTNNILPDIESSQSVSIHIRRGDYLQGDNINVFVNLCASSYYKNAIHYIEENINNPSFFVFSNDIDWVKNNMDIPNATFVSWNKKEDSWQDMFLMSMCKHNIIANSSFSWWGAWLNNNEDKIIIALSRFLTTCENNDLIPKEWITLEYES
ncbi:Glycosyl transferase family 11 [Bacteroidales bacterium Barb6]|nr:Glycosyl transferase family 11 [Bacteroidales bacterium Barb6]